MRLLLLFILLYVLGTEDSLAFSLEEVSMVSSTMPSFLQSNTDKEVIRITAYDNKIVVENAPIGSKLEIYSVVGIRVKEIVLKQSSGEYPVDIAKGYYIVRIGDVVRKIAIR